jgi:hypothetical protein
MLVRKSGCADLLCLNFGIIQATILLLAILHLKLSMVKHPDYLGFLLLLEKLFQEY